MALERDREYQQATSGLHHRTIAGITVLNKDSWEQPLVLNRALQMVWACLEFGGNVDDIAIDIVEVFDQDADQVRDDVEKAFHQLKDLGLIEVR